MKHFTLFLFILLAVLLTACGTVATPTPDYPIPGDPLPPTPTPAILTVTVNVVGELLGEWPGWEISKQFAPDVLADCTLYRIPETSPQQWMGKCQMAFRGILQLPWFDSDIVAVVRDADGFIVGVYQSP